MKTSLTIATVITLALMLAPSLSLSEEEYIQAKCFKCGKLYRVPVKETEELVVTCPHCGTQAKIKMPEPRTIAWEKANKYIGKEKIIEGTVTGTYKSPRSNNFYINLNPDFNTYGSVAIKSGDLVKFGDAPEAAYQGKKVRITGKIVDHKGKPRIWLTDPSQIEVF